MPVSPPDAKRGAGARKARILAFDTSTERLVVALHDGLRAATYEGAGGAAASASLLPQIHALLADAGLQLADLDAIAFGRGPGAFTGLRTSCAIAQGLAYGLGLPVVPIDSLAIVAEDARSQAAAVEPPTACDAAPDGLEVTVAMDARMNELYVGRYLHRSTDGDADAPAWQVLAGPALCPVDAFGAWLAGANNRHHRHLVAGSALAAFGADRLGLRAAGEAEAPGGAFAVAHERDRAAALLRLALAAHARGDAVDAGAALPVYLRDKVASTTAEREAARAAVAAATTDGRPP